MDSEYPQAEHVHRFAAWAASRAASTVRYRFKVSVGKSLLEEIHLNQYACKLENLPAPDCFDEYHRDWRNHLVAATNNGMSHGIAAKLINIYFKTLTIGADVNNPKISAIHPPIDRLLLKEICQHRKDEIDHPFWAQAFERTWTKFDSSEYQDVIRNFRLLLGENRPLWQIERYWIGHQ